MQISSNEDATEKEKKLLEWLNRQEKIHKITNRLLMIIGIPLVIISVAGAATGVSDIILPEHNTFRLKAAYDRGLKSVKLTDWFESHPYKIVAEQNGPCLNLQAVGLNNKLRLRASFGAGCSVSG